MTESDLLLGCFCRYGGDVMSANNFDIVMQMVSIVAHRPSRLK